MAKKSKTHFFIMLIVLCVMCAGVLAIAMADMRPASNVAKRDIESSVLTQ